MPNQETIDIFVNDDISDQYVQGHLVGQKNKKQIFEVVCEGFSTPPTSIVDQNGKDAILYRIVNSKRNEYATIVPDSEIDKIIELKNTILPAYRG